MCLKLPNTKAPPEAMVLVQVSASTLSRSASVGSHFTGNQIKLRCRAHTPVTSDPRAVTEQLQPFVPSHTLSWPPECCEVVTGTLDGAWDNSANDVLIFFHL